MHLRLSTLSEAAVAVVVVIIIFLTITMQEDWQNYCNWCFIPLIRKYLHQWPSENYSALTPNLPFAWGTGTPVQHNVTWDHMGVPAKWHLILSKALAGCVNVLDDKNGQMTLQ